MRAVMIWSMADYLNVLATEPVIMSEPARTRAHESGHRFLMSYQWLAGFCLRERVFRFKLRPKFHYFAHVCDYHLESAINSRFQHCFMDEDLMAKVKKLMS